MYRLAKDVCFHGCGPWCTEQVLEFVRFKERLEHSFSRSQAYAESAVLALSLLSTLPEGSVQQVCTG